MAATPAWAVGERIILPTGTPFSEQIRDTLCISMECVADGKSGLDATVTGKVVKAKKGQQVELQVISPTGAVKATVKAPASENGRMSSMDLVAATSAVITAIEAPEPKAKAAPAAKPVAKAQKNKSSKQVRLAVKGRFGHDRG
jgi:hypothetical protein